MLIYLGNTRDYYREQRLLAKKPNCRLISYFYFRDIYERFIGLYKEQGMKIYFAGNTMLRPREMMLLKLGKGQRLNSYWWFDLAWKKVFRFI